MELIFKLFVYGMDVCNEIAAGRITGGNYRT